MNRIFVGLDLGQKQDHSAIAVVERDEQRVAWMPSTFQCMRVRYLQQIPLGTPYNQVVSRVGEIVKHPLLNDRSTLIADATGVGTPVVDSLRAARWGCPITAVTITAGNSAHGGDGRWNVPKRDLLAGLLVLMEAGQFKIPKKVRGWETLIRELADVEVRYRTGGLRFGADGVGQHDDLVIAVALACWGARKKEIILGTRRLL